MTDARDPLIITATPNVCWLDRSVEFPEAPDDVAAEAVRCADAGAAILAHALRRLAARDRGRVRAATDMILQCGMSSRTPEARIDVFECKADMISIITSHHDEAFVGLDVHVLHPREELLEYARLQEGTVCVRVRDLEHGLDLEPELAHRAREPRGAVLHEPLLRLAWRRVVASDGRCLRLSTSPPATGSVATVNIMERRQIDIVGAAINVGDHVRVGTEDYPRGRDGQVATTHQLVAEVAELARNLGREIATPAQAREITGVRSLASTR